MMIINEDFFDDDDIQKGLVEEPEDMVADRGGSLKFVTNFRFQPTTIVRYGKYKNYAPSDVYKWFLDTLKVLEATVNNICHFIDWYNISISFKYEYANTYGEFEVGTFTVAKFKTFIKDYIDKTIVHGDRNTHSALFDLFIMTYSVEFKPKPVRYIKFIDDLNKLYMYFYAFVSSGANKCEMWFIKTVDGEDKSVQLKSRNSNNGGIEAESAKNIYELIYNTDPEEIDTSRIEYKYRDYRDYRKFIRRMLYYTLHPEYAHDENIKSVKVKGYNDYREGYMVSGKYGKSKKERQVYYILLELQPVSEDRWTDQNIIRFIENWFIKFLKTEAINSGYTYRDGIYIRFIVDNGKDVKCVVMDNNEYILYKDTVENNKYRKCILQLGMGDGRYRKFPPERTNKPIRDYDRLIDHWQDVIACKCLA